MFWTAVLYYMNQYLKRPVRSTTSQVIAMSALLTLLGIAIGLGIIVKNGLTTGRIYSPTVSALGTKLIYRETSPDLYWTFIAFYLAGDLMMLIAVLLGLREVIMEHKRKVEQLRSKKKAAT